MLNMVRKDSLLKNRIVLIGILKDLCKDIFENSIGATKLNLSLQGNKNMRCNDHLVHCWKVKTDSEISCNL